jgi:hypothetical protein
MDDMRNKPWQNVAAILGLLAILGTCYRLLAGILAG